MDTDEVSVANLEGVTVGMDGTLSLLALPRRLTKQRALVLAAWLVALADDQSEPTFGRILRRVLDT